MADPNYQYPAQPPHAPPPYHGPAYPPQAYPHDKGQYPPQAYPQTAGYPQHAPVVVNQPVVIKNPTFRESPLQTECPKCHKNVTTKLHYSSGTFTWLACLGISFFGGILGCCLIPFCVDGCKDVQHECPKCDKIIGRYSKI